MTAFVFLPLLLTVGLDLTNGDCGESGKFYRDVYQGVLFEKQKNPQTGKEFWTPTCVGALLPGKHSNYTDTLYIGSGCIRDDPSNYVIRYGTEDPIADTQHMRGRLIAVLDRTMPETGSHWNYGLSVAKFEPDTVGPTVQTVCLPRGRDRGPGVGSKCRLGVITHSGKLATLPMVIVDDAECRKMPSYKNTEVGEEIPYDPAFQACGKEIDEQRTFAHFKSHVGPIVCEHNKHHTLYGYFLIEPSTLRTKDPFRMTRINPHMDFVDDMRTTYLNDMIASMQREQQLQQQQQQPGVQHKPAYQQPLKPLFDYKNRK